MFWEMHPALLLALAGDSLGASDFALRFGAVLVLVLANGFMVAAEFALVGARRSKLEQMADEGDRASKDVLVALSQLDRYISGTQLGITISSLALGWIGEPALATLVDRAFFAAGFQLAPGAEHLYASIVTAFVSPSGTTSLSSSARKSFACSSSPSSAISSKKSVPPCAARSCPRCERSAPVKAPLR